MCIAIYSPIGVKPPCEQYLRNSFENNPDGAGFAFNMNGYVQICKGYMTFDSFIKAFERYDKQYGFTNKGVLIHFRIGTSGKNNKANTHPFPITESVELLQKTDVKSNFALIHNGIISGVSIEDDKKLNDTMVFTRDIVSRIASNKGWFDNSKVFELIYELANSKIAILSSNGKIHATKGFTKDADGNYYSNSSYTYSLGSRYGRYGYTGYYGYYDCFDSEMLEVPLMRLQDGEIAVFDDDTAEEFDKSYHADYPVYLSQEGEIYQDFTGYGASSLAYDELTFLGTGVFVDSKNISNKDGYIQIPFRKDAVCVLDDM